MEEIQNVVMQTPIEIALQIDENGMTTARKLYEFLDLNKAVFSRWVKTNIEKNEFYEEGTDWWGFNIVLNGNECMDYKITTDFAKHLSMESHSYKGKEARQYFITVEDKLKEVAQKPHCIEDVLIESLQEMKSMREKMDQQGKQIENVQERVESIREVVALDTTSWRDDTGNLLRKIGVELGGGQAFSQIRSESYTLLENRMGVNLQQRLTNKRRRMADEGVCKSKRDKLSYVDIISEDKKLIEGYVAIVKEMAIKYGVGKGE